MNSSWYPSHLEWEQDEDNWGGASAGLLPHWQGSLDNWRERRAGEGLLPSTSKPTPDEDLAWLRQRILEARLDLLPEPSVTTVKELLNRCKDLELRAEFGEQLETVGYGQNGVISIQRGRTDSLCDYLWIDDANNTDLSPGDDWSWDGQEEILIVGSHDYAARMAAWLEFCCGLDKDGKSAVIRWLKNGLSDLSFDRLKADHLREVADRENQQFERDQALLSSVREDIDPDDMVHRGLQRAVDQDRAGRRMRHELAQQEHDRDVVKDGWEAIEKRRKVLKELDRQIATLRGEEDNTVEGTKLDKSDES